MYKVTAELAQASESSRMLHVLKYMHSEVHTVTDTYRLDLLVKLFAASEVLHLRPLSRFPHRPPNETQ